MATDPKDERLAKATAETRTPDVITTPEEFRASVALWEQRKYHVLTPFSNLSGLAPQHGIMVSVVKLDPNKEAGEVYDGVPWLNKGEVAVAKIGLRKLAECAGISYTTQRTDNRYKPAVQHYWEFKATVSYRGVDGSIITREATKEWDLRDGAPQLKGWTANQISEGRKHGLRNCEARAINAAIREAGCGIKQKYTKEDLDKPFVVLRVAFRADMSDPDQKRMVLERALGSTAQVYPHAPAPHQAMGSGGGDDGGGRDDGGETFTPSEPRHVGQGTTADQRRAAPPAATVADAPPTTDAVKIVHVSEPFHGETNGRKWTKWTITDSRGKKSTTFSQTMAEETARKHKDAGTWVEIDVEGEYSNILQILPAGAQPDLPLPSET